MGSQTFDFDVSFLLNGNFSAYLSVCFSVCLCLFVTEVFFGE